MTATESAELCPTPGANAQFMYSFCTKKQRIFISINVKIRIKKAVYIQKYFLYVKSAQNRHKYYNKKNMCATRESVRMYARNRKQKRKRKRKSFAVNLYNAREGASCVRRGGCGRRAWRRRIMRSVKEKVCPCAHNTHKDRILQAVSTGFMRAFACKASAGRKILLRGKESVFNRFSRGCRFVKALRAHA